VSVGGWSRWACLLGHPVAHSLSPALHNAAFEQLGIDARYDARDVLPEDLTTAIEALREDECLGANVTAPHKQAAVDLIDEVSEEVDALGALNTIVNRNGRLLGSNTDAAGLSRWMRQVEIRPAGHPTLVLGAGGAARASVWALASLGASSVLILNRSPAHAQTLVAALGPKLAGVPLAWGQLEAAGEARQEPFAVVVNATSLGHHGGAPTVHPSCYSPDSTAIELAYNPPLTRFMVEARATGARAENGLGMLLHQAALAFERWTGQAPPMEVYEAIVQERVGG
jgi:shikimate dehydrogenase